MSDVINDVVGMLIEFLIASVSGAVINRLPHNYELVVHRG